MKNVSRVICLILVVLLAFVAFTACGDDEEGTSSVASGTNTASGDEPDVEIVDTTDAGFEFVDETISFIVSEDGVEKCDVVEGTTVKGLLGNITFQDGFSGKVFDSSDKEITDENAAVESGMKLKIFKGEEEKAVYEITVATADEIADTIDTANDQAADDGSNGGNGGNGGTASKSNSSKSTSSKSNSSKSNSSKSNGSKTSTASKSTNPVTSLKGYAFKLGTIFMDDFTGSSPDAKSNQAQIAKIKSKYGCTVSYVKYSATDCRDVISKEVAAGNAGCDVALIDLASARTLARNGVLADWKQSSTLKLSSTFKNASTEAMTYKKGCFGIAYPSLAGGNVMGVIFNKALVKQYGGGMDIYKLYNSNKWTTDNFKTLSNNIFEKSNRKVAGFVSNTNVIGMAMTAFAGGTALMKNGKVEATLCTQDSIDSMKWCKDLYNNGGGSWKYDPDINTSVKRFANKEAAMFVSYMNFYTQIATSANFEMGFVPMPRYAAKQSNYISGTYNGSYYVVPNTKKNKGSLKVYGQFMNELAAVSNAQINNTANSMKRNSLDSTAVSVYKKILKSCLVAEFSSGVFNKDFSDRVDAAVLQKSKDPTSVMEGLKSQGQKACDDYYSPLY